MSFESYDLDPTLARLLEEVDERPNLIGVTLERLHEILGNQGLHSLHEDGHKNSDIQQEPRVACRLFRHNVLNVPMQPPLFSDSTGDSKFGKARRRRFKRRGEVS